MTLIKHPDSVDPALIDLLGCVMGQSKLETFVLGGGTSLSLRFGHRSSDDLDFFSEQKFDTNVLQSNFFELFPGSQILNRTTGSLCLVARDIKIEFFYHPFKLLQEIDSGGQFRFLSLPDISGMKINAVTNRGSKKDFIDLYLLHTIGISIADSLQHFSDKYNGNKLLALRSLLWFEDAEKEPDPLLLNGWSWEFVKERIVELVDPIIR
ncbi:MAG: nucleotidyl transferase AbiEii/AbiGii toxin family protein [Spirochaetaceae bacterium]